MLWIDWLQVGGVGGAFDSQGTGYGYAVQYYKNNYLDTALSQHGFDNSIWPAFFNHDTGLKQPQIGPVVDYR